MNVGIKAKPPDPLNSAHEKDLVTRHPWNLVRGLTHLPLPLPNHFLNTSYLLKNTVKKKKKKNKTKKKKKVVGQIKGTPQYRIQTPPTTSKTQLKKNSNHSKSKKMRGNYQGHQLPASLPSNSQAFLLRPRLRVWLT